MWQRYRREVMRRQSVIDLKGWRFGSAARNYLIQRRRSRFPSITLKHFDVLKVVMWFKGREGVLNFSLHTADRAFPPPVIRRFKTLTGYQLLYHHIISFSYTFTPPRRCHDCTFAVSLLLLATFFTSCLSFFFFFVCLLWPQNRRSLSRNRRSTSQPRWRRWWTFPVRLEVSCVCLCVRINPLKLKQLVGVLFCCTWHIFYSPWSWSGDCFSLQYTGVAPLCKQENHGWEWD